MNAVTWATATGGTAPDAPKIDIQCANHAGISMHCHDFYELVYVRGGFCLHETDDRMTLLTEGDLFLLCPGQGHRYLGSRAVQLFNCLFDVSGLPRGLAEHELFRNSPPERIHLDLAMRKSVTRLMEKIRWEQKNTPEAWQTNVECLLGQLLCLYVRVARENMPLRDNPGYSGYVTPALSYIDRNYQQEITMTDLSREVGVSGDYLTRQFKLLAGITPLTYLRRYRIARAMELLGSGVSASEAAEKVGFHSLSHFSREFKHELGITPTQYKHQDHL